jgi:hypothetical protein
MTMLTRKDFSEVRTWIFRNARNLEITLWRYFFENGGRADVVSALSFYQNADGGFGHALEPDSWNPESSPYTTLYAINTLQSISFEDMSHPVFAGILRFLDSGTHYTDETGWLFSIPSNDAHPRAPWWTYSPEANGYESIGVTAVLAAFILTHGDKGSGLYTKALTQARRLMERMSGPGKFGDMGLNGFCVLLEAVRKAGLTAETVKKLVNDSIVRDTGLWPTYCVRPSNYIRSPDSPFYADNADIVRRELDYLVETRPKGGVWGIEWSWFDLGDTYPKEFAIAANWWRAIMAVEKMRLLRSFGRIEI